jgi:hypothetical protein
MLAERKKKGKQDVGRLVAKWPAIEDRGTVGNRKAQQQCEGRSVSLLSMIRIVIILYGGYYYVKAVVAN